MTSGTIKSSLIVMFAMLIFGSTAWAQAGASAAKPAANTYVTPTNVYPVVLYSKDDVDAGFKRGDTLYQDKNDKVNFKIATSRREKPGTGEVHGKWTDVVYIMKGSATIVTGGTMLDVKSGMKFPDGTPFPKEEIRGGAIVGGETRHLKAGDVIIIPNGVPHAFTEVEPSFWYLNVKVR